jgi:hypothetical protein
MWSSKEVTASWLPKSHEIVVELLDSLVSSPHSTTSKKLYILSMFGTIATNKTREKRADKKAIESGKVKSSWSWNRGEEERWKMGLKNNWRKKWKKTGTS